MERAGEGEIIHDRRLLPKIDRRCTPFARAKVALAQTRARRGDYAAAMARIRFEDDAIEVDARVIDEGLRTNPERVVAEIDRKSVVLGKSVSVRVDPGGRRNINHHTTT